MSGNDVDYYDVQGMIRDARAEIRSEITRAVAEVTSDVMDRMRAQTAELEREIEGLRRTLNSRTEQFA